MICLTTSSYEGIITKQAGRSFAKERTCRKICLKANEGTEYKLGCWSGQEYLFQPRRLKAIPCKCPSRFTDAFIDKSTDRIL